LKESWDELSIWEQAMLIGYDQVRQKEEIDELGIIAGTRIR
jgi:hypothetical protein